MKLHECPVLKLTDMPCGRDKDCHQRDMELCPNRRLYSAEQVAKYVYGFWAKYEKFPTEHDVTDTAKGIAAWAEREEKKATISRRTSNER